MRLWRPDVDIVQRVEDNKLSLYDSEYDPLVEWVAHL